MSKLMTCLRDEEGATAIEYGLIIGIMAVLIIAAFTLFGNTLSTTMQTIVDAM
jgi:pilus assembly protein Flp/PilA